MQRALSGLRGVRQATVALETGEAVVETDGSTPLEAMERAVQGQVILSWARRVLSKIPVLGRGNR